MHTAFDRSLELCELRHAAEEYAASHGEPGTAAYRAAWINFRQQIRSINDLQRLRARIPRPKGVARTSPHDQTRTYQVTETRTVQVAERVPRRLPGRSRLTTRARGGQELN